MTLTTGQLAERVEAVLAGTAVEHSAVDDIDLSDAVATYRAAGRAALTRRRERVWFQARLAWPDWADAEPVFAAHVAARLDDLDNVAAWWFLRKYPHWRLRVRSSDHRAVAALLDGLVTAGTITGWQPGLYEPEAAAFGGEAAMPIVHDLFCADSRGVLTYAGQCSPALGRRELSLLLIRAMLQHAGLDWFETGDVFDRVAQMRPTPADHDTTGIDALAVKMRPALAVDITTAMPLFTPGGHLACAAPWLAAFIEAGKLLGEAATANRLDRGLRATTAQIVIFHWNRLGLSAQAQGILAHAGKAATLPRS
ncbi:thiopeptide-type bacteriocin biosynthesis protein [Actinoplanes sp. NPDC051513]|uniref:thiopeptide-type bacteriocin biosynthesis protein n=1 Tax=Actinoplanes sp. NPDC051513 TaxID=3363908 RepID=UPI0037A618D4